MFPEAVDDSYDELLASLNEEQQVAVTHDGGPLLVLAGAGCGKTTTLVSRLAWLVLVQGVSPERVLLLTFTRRASRQMLARARVLLGASAGQVVGGTFHAVAHKLLRLYAASVGLPPTFSLLDPGDAADLLDLLREEQGLATQKTRFPRKATLLDVYSRTVNAQQPLSKVLAEWFPWCEEHREPLAQLFRSYGERKRTLGVLDFDDLLLYWRALAQHEVIGAQLAQLFREILVDEYQDLNALQVDILRGCGGSSVG